MKVTRVITAVVLSVQLAAPPANILAAPVSGTLNGIVTIDGRPVSGISLSLVDLSSGTIHKTQSGQGGAFEVQLTPGEYVITSGGQGGLAVGRGPTRVVVSAGQVATTSLELVALAVPRQEPPPAPPEQPATEPQAPSTAAPAAPEATTINHDPIGCFIAGQFPIVDAGIEPAAEVARARVYFKAAQSSDWFYIEMVTEEGKFLGKMPRPQLAASPIHYYIQATTTTFGESQTPEIEALVVAEEKDCPGDKKVAALWPGGPVQVFSAATGAAIAPAGFAAGGLAIAGTTIAIIAGAAAIGIGTAIVVTHPTPTPIPTPRPTPKPSPSPRPSPSPSPSPSPTKVPSPPPGSFSR
jgi:hypothetical protein